MQRLRVHYSPRWPDVGLRRNNEKIRKGSRIGQFSTVCGMDRSKEKIRLLANLAVHSTCLLVGSDGGLLES